MKHGLQPSAAALERKIKMKIGESPFLVSIDSAKLHKYGIWNMIISLLKVLLQKLYLISSCGLQHVIILDCFTILHAFSISSHILGEQHYIMMSMFICSWLYLIPTTEGSKNRISMFYISTFLLYTIYTFHIVTFF